MGRVGVTDAQGFYLHTAMIVSADRDELVGLAAQELYARPLKKFPRVSSARRKKLACETDMWGRVIDEAGTPPADTCFVHACHRVRLGCLLPSALYAGRAIARRS